MWKRKVLFWNGRLRNRLRQFWRDFFSASKIAYFNCCCKVLVRKAKSASWADRWNLLRSWLPPEPRAVLRRPSKQGPKQLKGSNYPRREWHGHLGSWRKGRSGQGSCRRKGQRRKKGSDKREGQWGAGRQGWLSHGRPSVWGDQTAPDHTPAGLWGQGGALLWASEWDWLFINPAHAGRRNPSGLHH